MKKFEDFKCNKVEVDSIYGGKMLANTFDCNTVTVGPGSPADGDDGSDEEWDN